MTVRVLLDTDIGDDIDDAWALAFCLCHPKVELVGVTTVWGDVEIRTALAKLLVKKAGRDVEVVAGCRGGLDGRVPLRSPLYADVLDSEDYELKECKIGGVKFMAEVSKRYPGLVLLTIGPLTNAARFAIEYPEEFRLLSKHVMMCGHLIKGRRDPEYNASCDPKAVKVVLSTEVPKFVIGLDVTLECTLTDSDIEVLKTKRSPLAKILYTMTYLWRKRTGKIPVMHDPLAAASIVEEGIVEFKPMKVEVDNSGRLVRTRGKPNVNYAVKANPELLRRRLLEVIN
ncbi:MAG: hypothetical protein B6U69_01740 [Thermofilum sp. ex4484_15]|nr:MAG: hypothetical protein B6U69_01740 [Thermofilum sp. ex4484_15]